ncbi:hypothetical protein B4N84_05720 [Flavobacterium sp. IR1]|nr:hypothetical protein B4N84_05720 [Flavobacterium sp. IR1]
MLKFTLWKFGLHFFIPFYYWALSPFILLFLYSKNKAKNFTTQTMSALLLNLKIKTSKQVVPYF